MLQKGERKCRICGVTLTSENWFSSYQKYSNYVCRTCDHKRGETTRRKHAQRTCPNCQSIFISNSYNQVFCSTKCGKTYRGLHVIGQPCRKCGEILTINNISGMGKTGQQICKNCRRNWMRERVIYSLDGQHRQIFCGLHKRLYPLDGCCEICNEKAIHLGYHHWDDQNPSKGLWMCGSCHWLCNYTDRLEKWNYKQNLEKYLFLRRIMDQGLDNNGQNRTTLDSSGM